MLSKRLMYAFLIQLFLCTVLFANTGNAQRKTIEEVKVSLNFKEKTLLQFFKQVETKTDFKFTYNDDLVDLSQKVTVDERNQSLYKVLEAVSKQADLHFVQVNENIHVKSVGGRAEQAVEIAQLVDVTVSGTVTDENGEPIPGVTVSVPGTSAGTATDLDGRYTLSVPEGSTLVFSFIGFVTQSIAVGSRSVVDVVLEEDMASLDEVVVVGYGVIQKKHMTGSSGSITMDETLASRPVIDFGQAMYGKIAGVQVMNTSGRPGESSRLQIRGVNSLSAGTSPLIVVDGVPMPNFDLNSVNASDIQSIDILKDAASAAIYGSRGANGVVLVTTKSGVSQKTSVNVNYQMTLQQAIQRIEVMNASEYAQASIDAAQIGWIRSGGDPNAPNTLEARGQRKYTWPEALENPENLFDTDWQDVLLRTAPMHKADVSITGGGEKSQFYLSFGAIIQEGIVIDTDYNRFNINFNADTQVTSWLKLGGMLNAIHDKENVSNLHTLTANQYPPIYPIYGENGYLGGPLTVPGFEEWNAILFRANHGHPYYRTGEIDEVKGLRGMANVFAEISFLPSLKFRSSFRGYYGHSDRRFYDDVDREMGPGATRPGAYLSSVGRTVNITSENILTYSKNWKGHQLDAVAGYEFNKKDFYSMSAERRNYDHDLIPYLSAGSLVYGASDSANEYALISLLGRINYNYQSKYIASLAFRRDGSSRFGPRNKWGNFPAVSGGWRLSEEKFMENLRSVNNLILRASYGFTGNDNFADYTWISRMAQSRAALGSNLITTYFPSSVENQELRWERTRQINVGIDLGLWDDRLQLEIDAYQSTSDDLLLNVPVPSTSGFTSVFTNIGELENKGIELSLNSWNINTDKLKWGSQVTFSHNRGIITELGSNNAPMILTREQMSVINEVGRAPFSFFGYDYLGVYVNQGEVDSEEVNYPYTLHPGMGRYRDVNGDGEINSEDRTVIGNAQPDFIWALTNTVQFKNFDFSILFHGSVGGQVFDSNWHRSMYFHEGRNYLKEANNRWRSEAEPGNGHIHALSVDVAGTYEREASSYWITDGTYARLKDVTVGYTIQDENLSKRGISKLRVYLNATNLFTIQKTTTMDPENMSGGPGDVASTGIQFSPYPSAKTFTLGLNVKF